MSTCPDKDLYSAYIDGELQSPWKEMIVSHLESCEKCRSVVNSYKKISLKLSASSLPELDLDGSFLKLYAKRQECIQHIETNQKKYTSWMYKSVKIPIPALVAAAMFLFVCTPIIVLGTRKSLAPSVPVVSGFKSVFPVSNHTKTVNRFSLNITNIFGLEKLPDTNKEINLYRYMNLYLPPEDPDFELNDVLEGTIKSDSIFLNDKTPMTVTSVKNGK